LGREQRIRRPIGVALADASCLAPEFVRHDANLPDVVGPQAERQHIADDLAAFPDLHFEIEQLIAEGDLVAARYLVQGTHRGRI
jgi:predicted ester cyclase